MQSQPASCGTPAWPASPSSTPRTSSPKHERHDPQSQSSGCPDEPPIGDLNTRRGGESGQEIRTVVVAPSAPDWCNGPSRPTSGDWTILGLTDALAGEGPACLPHGRKVPGPVQPSHVNYLLKTAATRAWSASTAWRTPATPAPHRRLAFDRGPEVLAPTERRRRPADPRHYLKGSLFCAGCGRRPRKHPRRTLGHPARRRLQRRMADNAESPDPDF